MTLAALALAWIVGTYCVVLFDHPRDLALPVLLLGIAALPAGWAVWTSPRLRFAALVTGALLFGAARALTAEAAMEHDPLAAIVGQQHLRGIISTAPWRSGERTSSALEIDARLVDGSWVPQTGRAWLQLYGGATLQYGDVVEVRGRIAEPLASAGYPLPTLMRRQGTRYLVEQPSVRVIEPGRGDPFWSAVHGTREAIAASIRRFLPEPHASFLAGLLVGTRTQMPDELREALVSSGTSHVVAVSGFNVVVLAGMLIGLLSRTGGRRFLLLPTLSAIALYTALSGPQPSAIRAALMASAGLLAASVGRIADPITSLLAAGALMLAFEPLQALDLGFQLSLLATAGLILFQTPLASRMALLPRWAAEPLAATLAAQLATLPLIASTFHTLSVVSPVANVLIAPVLPPLMALGGLLAAVSPIPPLASVVAWPCWALVGYVLAVIGMAGSAPGALAPVGGLPTASVAAVTLSVCTLGALALPEVRLALARVPLPGRRAGALAAAAGLLVLTLAPAAPLLVPSDGQLRAWTLDLGGAAALLVRTPSGRHLLIADAPPPARLADSLARHLRPWESRLSALALPDANALGSLGHLLARYPADLVLLAAPTRSSARDAGAIALEPGERLELDQDVSLSRWPAPANGLAPSAWRIEHGSVALLVAATRDALAAEHPAGQSVQVAVLTSRPREAGKGAVSQPGWARLLIVPGATDSSLSTGAVSPVVLGMEHYGEVELESDGLDLLARPAQCNPPSANRCQVLLASTQ